jgi:hypothetical protein
MLIISMFMVVHVGVLTYCANGVVTREARLQTVSDVVEWFEIMNEEFFISA